MNEEQWLTSTKPHEMLESLRDRGVASERKLRLFSVACCRRAWEVPQDARVRSAVELVERYADNPDLIEEFRRLDDPASLRQGGVNVPYLGRKDAFQAAAGVSLWIANLVSGRSKPQGYTDPRWLAERAVHVDLLRDIMGNPFLPLQSAVTEWNDGLIMKLAEATYEFRSLPSGLLDPVRLAVLADALEEAGCTDATLLRHLREPTIHVRGCFAVDLLLGKE